MSAQLICVFGATGVQGGSVVRALLKNEIFKVRGVTRNRDSPKAKALTDLGVELVQASFDDASTLPAALSGCHGVFGVTNYWEHMNVEKEITQGKTLVDACKAAGVQHLVFSLLADVKEVIGYACPNFDAKAEIEKYMFAAEVPCTSVRYPFYMENFLGVTKPEKQADGEYQIVIPIGDTPMYTIYGSGAGEAVAAIFRCKDEYLGKTIGLAGDKLTSKEYQDIINKHLAPKKLTIADMPIKQYAQLGFPGAAILAVMYDFYRQGKQVRDVELTRRLDPATLSFEGWVKENKDALNAAMD